MIPIYVFIDVCSFETSLILAFSFGSSYLPNFFVLIAVFFVIRSLIYLFFFRVYLKRELPFVRLLTQSIILISTTFFVIFLVTSAIDLLPKIDLSLAVRYYLISPLLAVGTSSLLHRLYRLETWQS